MSSQYEEPARDGDQTPVWPETAAAVSALLGRRSSAPHPVRAVHPFHPSDDEIQGFASLLAEGDTDACAEFVELLLGAGVSRDSVRRELFGPAAACLGQRWVDDQASFVDVTIGVGRLHQLAHLILAPRRHEEPCGRALLTVCPGEQHLFSALMAAHALMEGGWEVWTEPPDKSETLLRTIEEHEFDIVGLSASGDVFVERLPGLVQAIRERSLNPDVRVMIGGGGVLRHPDAVQASGADAVVADGRNVVAEAARLLASQPVRENKFDE